MNKNILAIFFITYLFSLAAAQVPPFFNETCETDKYPPAPSTIVATYEVNLDLPPEERWVEIAQAFKEPLKELLDYIVDFIRKFSPALQKVIDLVDNDLGFLAYTLPAPYGDEIIGIANATGINLGEIVLYNIFYEVFTLCTSIVGQDAQGNTLHGRNLDFGLFTGWDIGNDTWKLPEMLRPVVINVNYTRGGVVQYKTVTFVGFVGVITGLRENGLSLSINERFAANGGYIGLIEWILDINREQAWATFLARDAFENNLSYNETLKMLSTTPLLAPCYYIIGGPGASQAAVVTRNRANSEDVWQLSAEKSFYLAETNYDHWKAPLFIDDRITPTNTCMNKFGQDGFSFSGMFNVLSSKPVLNKLTVYTALMEIQTGRLETYIQYCPSPCWPF